MDIQKFLRVLIQPWVIGGAILLAIFLLVLTIASLWFSRPKNPPLQQVTAIINVIPALTSTPTLPTPTPTTPPDPTLSPDQIAIGIQVQVTGTGGDGLRLRVNPSLDSQIWMIAQESEIFSVEDGPRQSDGYTWWFIASPEEDTRRGWAVAEFLKPVIAQELY
jgi:hypothetical protein